MNSQQWKKVLDDLDENIVDSAAERFSKSGSSGEEADDYSNGKPKEYRFPAGRKRGGILVGIGSAAVAAAMTGVILLNRSTTQPPAVLSQGATLKSGSQDDSFILYIEDAAGLEESFSIMDDLTEIPQSFSGEQLSLFDQYFYGTWSSGEDTITLSDSAASAFSSDYPCTGIIQTASGCYMGAANGQQYDLWFVLNSVPDVLHVYRNCADENGAFLVNDDGTISCESTGSYQLSGSSPDEYNTLGYFGKMKLAYDLGLTPEALYSKSTLDTYAGSDAGEAHWIRSGSDYESPWDKVVLKSRSEDSIVMSMAFTQSSDSLKIMYFDMYWYLTDSGEWAMQDVKKSGDVFALTADDLRVTLTLSDLDIFEMYFAGTWASDSEEFVLSYSQDIFSGTGYCGGFYTDQDGWYMYHLMDPAETRYTQVYYVPYSDPFTMYLYEPDIYGYAVRDNYLAVYTRTDFGLDELDTSHMSWLGLQRWILDTTGDPGDDTLSAAVYSAFSDIGNDDSNAGNYNGSGDAFEGYAVEELSAGKYRLTFQLFDQENNSQWVSVVLKKVDNQWELLPADGITADTIG